MASGKQSFREHCATKWFLEANPRNISASKISHYTVCSLTACFEMLGNTSSLYRTNCMRVVRTLYTYNFDRCIPFIMPQYACASEVYGSVFVCVCLPLSACVCAHVCWKQTKNVPYLCLCRLHAIYSCSRINEVK